MKEKKGPRKMRNLGSSNGSGLSTDEIEDEEMARMAIATFQAREEEIERKKMEVKERVELQLGRAEEESRRLAQIWEVSSSKALLISWSYLRALHDIEPKSIGACPTAVREGPVPLP